MGGILGYLMGWSLPAVILLLVGLALMVAEMFTPGMGVPGILGLCCLLGAMVLRADSFASAVITLAIIIVILAIAAFFIYRSFQKGAISRSPIVLRDAIVERSTSLSDMDAQSLVGLEGECLTALRPTGNADFDGRRLDVVSEGGFIEKGSRVRIERVEGLRILVKKVQPTQETAPVYEAVPLPMTEPVQVPVQMPMQEPAQEPAPMPEEEQA